MLANLRRLSCVGLCTWALVLVARAGEQGPVTDANGDALPPGAVARLGTTRLRVGSRGTCAAFSPDGKLFAASEGDVVRVWEAAGGKERERFEAKDVTCLAFSPDARDVAVGCPEGLLLWRRTRHKFVARMQHPDRVAAVDLSPDGRRIATLSTPYARQHGWGKEAVLSVWDPATGRLLCRERLSATERSGAVKFSPCGRFLAASAGPELVLWDADGRELRRLRGHAAAVDRLAFSRDGGTLASLGDREDGTLRLWDTSSGREIRRLSGGCDEGRAVFLKPGGGVLVATDGVLRHWDEGRPPRRIPLADWEAKEKRVLAFSPDGRRVAAEVGAWVRQLRFWDTGTGREIREAPEGHAGWATAAVFTDGGRTVVTGGYDGVVRFWSRDTTVQRRLEGMGELDGFALSADGRSLAAVGDERIDFWDVASGRRVWRKDGLYGSLNCSTAISPDGRTVAVAAAEHEVGLLDTATGRELRRLKTGDDGGVAAVAFAPDGRTLAVAFGQRVGLWDLRSGKRLWDRSADKYGMRCLAFSPDGRTLAVGGHAHEVRLWDVAAGREVRQFVGHEDDVEAVAYSPDGRHLASGGADRTVRLWAADTGELLHCFRGHEDNVPSVSFSPDGQRLVSSSQDSTVLVWAVPRDERPAAVRRKDLWRGLADPDPAVAYRAVWGLARSPDEALPLLHRRPRPETESDRLREHRVEAALRLLGASEAPPSRDRAEAPRRPQPVDALNDPLPAGAVLRLGTDRFRHFNLIYSVAWSPDGRVLASSSWDATVRLWDSTTGRSLHLLKGHNDRVKTVAFTRDGGRVVSADEDGRIIVWDALTGRVIRQLNGHPGDGVAVSPDGRHLAASESSQGVCLWDLFTGRRVRRFRANGEMVQCVAFSPDGKTLAAGGYDRSVRLWDVASGGELARLSYQNTVLCVAFSPDGTTVAAAGNSVKGVPVCVWETATGRLVHQLWGHGEHILGVAFSPDGRSLASASQDHTVRLWDTATGRGVRVLRGHTNWAHGVAFSPDGKTLASGGWDNVLRLWNVDTGEPVLPFGRLHEPIRCLAVSPDGRTIAAGSSSETVRLWDARTGRELHTLNTGMNCVYLAAFAPDGRTLCTAGNGQMSLWEVRTGRRIRDYGPTGYSATWHLAFTEDGRGIVTGQHVWDVAAGSRVARYGPLDDDAVAGFSRDGDWRVAAIGEELVVEASGRPEPTRLPHPPERPRVLTVSPDGDAFAFTVTKNPEVRLWHPAAGREFVLPTKSEVADLVFSADGAVLAGTGPDGVRLWETQSGQPILSLPPQPGSSRVAFSPGGRFVLTGGDDSSVLVWDVVGKTDLPEDRWWADLAADAATAHRAAWTMADHPDRAVPLLRKQLRPITRADPELVTRLVADLDADSFEVREKATRRLEEMGEAAVPAVRRALKADGSLETRTRLEKVLRAATDPMRPEALRSRRAVAVLERADTPGARRLLNELAGGLPEAAVTRDARAALRRLSASPR